MSGAYNAYGNMRNAYKIFIGKRMPDHLGDLNRRIILKCMLKE
jgi:hypothetical protein